MKARTQLLGNFLAKWPSLRSAAEGGRLYSALLWSRQKCPVARPNQKRENQKCAQTNFRVSEYDRQLFRGSNSKFDGLENPERSKNRKFRLQEKLKETVADQSTQTNSSEELRKNTNQEYMGWDATINFERKENFLQSRQKYPTAYPNQKQKNQKCAQTDFGVSRYGRLLLRGSNDKFDGLEKSKNLKKGKFALQTELSPTEAVEEKRLNSLKELCQN